MTIPVTNKPLAGAVACENKLASDIGTRILQAGGTAADAIIASNIAVCITCPHHADIGGGGFAVIRNSKNEYESVDFRPTAPMAVTTEYYQDHPTDTGGSSVCVPSQMRALKEIHDKYGRLPWNQLFTECIELARDKLVMKPDLRRYIVAECKEGNRKGSFFEDEMFSPYFNDQGKVIEVGTSYHRPEYARALELMSEDVEVCYSGEIGQAMVKAARRSGGLMTMDDLTGYKVKWTKAISGKRGEHTIWSTPAPAAGAILINMLGIIGAFKAEGNGSILDMHRFTEALRLAYGTRTQIGDPAFVTGLDEAQARWTSEEFAKERANMIDDTKTFDPDYYTPPNAEVKYDHGTASLTAADSDGLVISMTTTVGMAFGSKVVTEHGILLNGGMDDFTVKGQPNETGYHPGVVNHLTGGMRPLSTSCPYIIADSEGRPCLAGGGAGGAAILSANTIVARNVLDYGMTASEAQKTTRIHNQVLPNVTTLERHSNHQGIDIDPLSQDKVEALEAKGHKIEWEDVSVTCTCAIRFMYDQEGENGVRWEAAGEPRKDDAGGSVFYPEA